MGFTVTTGASSGIGYETALVFSAKGKNLILIARRMDKLEELKEKILFENNTLNIVLKSSDLSDRGQVYELYEDL